MRKINHRPEILETARSLGFSSVRECALVLYEKQSIRAVSRIMRVSHTAVRYWFELWGELPARKLRFYKSGYLAKQARKNGFYSIKSWVLDVFVHSNTKRETADKIGISVQRLNYWLEMWEL